MWLFGTSSCCLFKDLFHLLLYIDGYYSITSHIFGWFSFCGHTTKFLPTNANLIARAHIYLVKSLFYTDDSEIICSNIICYHHRCIDLMNRQRFLLYTLWYHIQVQFNRNDFAFEWNSGYNGNILWTINNHIERE